MPYFVRKVRLPSGRVIEVKYFSPEPLEDPEPMPTVDLSICPECEYGLVYPLEWEEVQADKWLIELRCPNCWWESEEVHEQYVVDAFDDALNRGDAVIRRDLHGITQSNMEDEIYLFRAALDANAIWPMDF